MPWVYNKNDDLVYVEDETLPDPLKPHVERFKPWAEAAAEKLEPRYVITDPGEPKKMEARKPRELADESAHKYVPSRPAQTPIGPPPWLMREMKRRDENDQLSEDADKMLGDIWAQGQHRRTAVSPTMERMAEEEDEGGTVVSTPGSGGSTARSRRR